MPIPTTVQRSNERLLQKDKKRNLLRSLYTLNFIHMLAMIMIQDAKLVVTMNHFKGDAAAVARTQALPMGIMTLSGMFTTPLFSSLSDAYGRKVLLLLSPLWAMVSRLVEFFHPTAGVVQKTTALAAPLLATMLAIKTSIGDIFESDARGAGGAIALMHVGPLLAAVVGPRIGGALTVKSVRLTFAVSGLLSVLECLLVFWWIPETLPRHLGTKRAEPVWKRINPLKFFELFSRGPKLSILCIAQFLSDFVEPRVLAQTSSLVHTETLGWGVIERGHFISTASIVSVPGYVLAGKLAKYFGGSVALLIGSSASISQSLLDAFWVRKPWQQFAVLPIGLPRGTGVSALSSLVFQAAEVAGISQSDLQGSLQSLQTLTMAIAFPLWAQAYSFCARKGKPRRFYLFVAAGALLQLILAQSAFWMSLQQIPDEKKESGKGDKMYS